MDLESVVDRLCVKHQVDDPQSRELLKQFIQLDSQDEDPQQLNKQGTLTTLAHNRGGNLPKAIEDFLENYWSLWYHPSMPQILAYAAGAIRQRDKLALRHGINNPESLKILMKLILHYQVYEGSANYREANLEILSEAAFSGDDRLMDAIRDIQNS